MQDTTVDKGYSLHREQTVSPFRWLQIPMDRDVELIKIRQPIFFQVLDRFNGYRPRLTLTVPIGLIQTEIYTQRSRFFFFFL